jgi:hypothetical protein
MVAGALHCKRATAHADAPKALATRAGCVRRLRNRGATPQLWVKGCARKVGSAGGAAKADTLPQERKWADEAKVSASFRFYESKARIEDVHNF